MQTPSEDAELRSPVPASVGRGPGGLLVLGGLGIAAAGSALAVLPRLAPQFDWSVRNLASEGVMGGTFAVGGVLMIAIGLAARAQARYFRNANERSDADLMLEHLAGELADIRAELHDTRQRIGSVSDETRGLFEAVQARETMDTTDHAARDATFRMAASLDQLGARLDQRLQAQDAAAEKVFGELRQNLGEVRTLAEELRRSLDAAPQAQPQGPSASEAPDVPLPSAAPEGPPQGLELLDSLDQQAKLSPSDAPAGGAHTPELGMAGEPPAPLPSQAAEPTPISLSMRTGPMEVGDERIEEIRTLLADERVREALRLSDQ